LQIRPNMLIIVPDNFQFLSYFHNSVKKCLDKGESLRLTKVRFIKWEYPEKDTQP
jgi:hypothetical protein